MGLTLQLNGTANRVVVHSLAEASKAFREWIDSNDFGMSDLKKGAGDVRDDILVVARISYNGRIWNTDGKEVLS